MDKNSVKGPTVIHFFTHKSNNIWLSFMIPE
jgi:hypothetical protein